MSKKICKAPKCPKEKITLLYCLEITILHVWLYIQFSTVRSIYYVFFTILYVFFYHNIYMLFTFFEICIFRWKEDINNSLSY